MSFIQWKQIDPRLYDDARLTGSLYVTGAFFLNDVNILSLVGTSGIFQKTGSYWATTNDIEITGSFRSNLNVGESFEVHAQNEVKLQVNDEGVLVLTPFTSTPTPVNGGLIYSGSNEFYLAM